MPKIKKGLELREAVNGRAPWIKLLPPTPPTVWFHCASGEFEYAKPVIALIKKELPQLKIVVTYFSPTYVDQIRKFAGVDWVVPLAICSSCRANRCLA
jgi:3-deoxy-D-manno-octulosonic-acid transferase